MYVSVFWQSFTTDSQVNDEITHAVDLAFGTVPRAKLLQRAVVLRPATTSEISSLIAQLDSVEQAYTSQFGYTLFFHTDGERFRCSDPFDTSAARAITKAVPI